MEVRILRVREIGRVAAAIDVLVDALEVEDRGDVGRVEIGFVQVGFRCGKIGGAPGL